MRLSSSPLLGIAPLSALPGEAPGGISGMSLVGTELGVGAAVATLNAGSLIEVLLVLLLIVKFLIPSHL